MNSETEKHFEWLPCELSQEEIHARGEEIAKLAGEHERTEAEKKADVDTYNAELKTNAQRQSRLAKQMREGIEYRDVEVFQERDELGGAIQIIRNDTGEVVRSRPMTEDEKQLGMFPAEAKDG